LFLLLQIKEFMLSLYSINDGLLGSIYYFTTGLHGTHVVLGSFLLWSLLFSSLLYWTYHMELSLSLLLASYYWHFVDMIWFIVFSLYII
jgi:heme/copper-type cytochrome/quinol oxidase subunit 3